MFNAVMIDKTDDVQSVSLAQVNEDQLPEGNVTIDEVGMAKTAEDKLRIARERSAVWLQRLGDPYVVSVFDLDGRVGIDYGVYGVPETYIIDKEGVIRFKQVGAVTLETLQSQILPLVQKLNAS